MKVPNDWEVFLPLHRAALCSPAAVEEVAALGCAGLCSAALSTASRRAVTCRLWGASVCSSDVQPC